MMHTMLYCVAGARLVYAHGSDHRTVLLYYTRARRFSRLYRRRERFNKKVCSLLRYVGGRRSSKRKRSEGVKGLLTMKVKCVPRHALSPAPNGHVMRTHDRAPK
jgi:hypothetical protein